MSTIFSGSVNESFGVHLVDGKVEGPTVTVAAEAVLLNSTPFDGNGNKGHALWVSNGPYAITNSGTIFTSSVSGEVAAGIFVDATAGGSKITNKAEGSISGYAYGIDANAGTTIANAGLISGFTAINFSSFGNASPLTITNTGLIASINAAGWDENTFTPYAIRTAGDGKHSVTNGATGEIFGNILMSGLVTLKNDGFVEGNVTLSGATGSTVTFANKGFMTGDDPLFSIQLTNGLKHVATNASTGIIDGGIDFGFDNSEALYAGSFKNDGLVDGNVAFDAQKGNMSFANKGIVDGNVSSNTTNVNMTNSGTITGNVDLGGGNDIFKNTGTVELSITLGAGNDQFFGGAKQGDTVTDEAGTDIYKFGSRNDIFNAIGTGSELNTDTVDGGANLKAIPGIGVFGDVYDASAAGGTTNLRINMDTVNITSLVFGVASGTVMTAGTATDSVGGSKFGTDLIKNFETAYGGAGSDIIIGNTSANALYGNVGNDELWGGKGNDSLNGGLNTDFLFGGLGRDQLRGGEGGGDSLTTDYFIYTNINESTVALTGRDLIQDFTNDDTIDIRAFGMTSFAMIGAASSFNAGDATVGEGKIIQTNIGWTFLLDSNNDGKVDFAIDFFDPTHTNQLLGASIDWN